MKSHRFTKKSPRKTVVRLVTGTLVAMALGACGDDLEAPSEGEDASLGEPVELAQDDLEALARDVVDLDAPEMHEGYELSFGDGAVQVFTFLDAEGNKQSVAVDTETGEAMALEERLAIERERQVARCGKLDESLCAALDLAAEGDLLPVDVWFVHAEKDVDRSLAARSPERFQAALDARAKARRTVGERVARGLDKHLGRRAFTVAELAPVLTAELTPREIRLIAKTPEVGQVMLGGMDPVEDLAGSQSLSNWTPASHRDGTNVRVGILETGRPDVTTQLPSMTIRDTSGSTSSHARLVTGIVANTSTTPGYANASSLYIGNRVSGDTDIADIDWAVSNGTSVHNQSWHFTPERTATTLSARDRYLDYVTRANAKFFATAASNADDRNVVHKGYNIVTVGSAYANGAIVDGNVPSSETCGLSSSYVSSWRNGVPQELPHITADGGCITAVGTTNAGTSFAAPAVTGMAAGLAEVDSTLNYWPEALKAIFLASPTQIATQTPDGCPWRYRRNASGSCSLLDGRDGTGLVNGYQAELIAGNRSSGFGPDRRGFDYGYITKSSFDTSSFLLNTKHYAEGSGFCGYSGERLRVALAWDSDASCTTGSSSSCSDNLDMDLDLRVYEEPGGYLVGQSATTVNSYEHVDIPIRGPFSHCTPSGTDWYYRVEVRLANYASVSSSEATYYGLAWSIY
ncbi:MAG: S8 family serine peptidase [Polyangiaceae bacterium]